MRVLSCLKFDRRILFSGTLVSLLLITSVTAQTDKGKLPMPDFSGTWVFEKSSYVLLTNSDLVNYSSRFVITQNSSEIVLAERSFMENLNKKSGERKTVVDINMTMVVFPDGRGEVNVVKDKDKEVGNFYSKTEWQGRKLRTTYFSGPVTDLKRKVVGTTEMEISKDGKTLVFSKKTPENYAFVLGPIRVQDPNNRKDTYKRSQ